MKPERQFNANEGDYSVGLAGPDAIEEDIDTLARMFDPLTTHVDGTTGGIATENIQDGAITDTAIGNRTINDSTADVYTNTGMIGKLLSLIAKAIKGLKGTTNWFEAPSDTINNIHTRVSANATNITNHKTSADHDSRYYPKEVIDPWLSAYGGETIIKEEVFVILSSDNGDGTFTYSNGVNTVVGNLLEGGEQVFTLNGQFDVGLNRLEVFVDDTVRKSVNSGGIIEVGSNQFSLVYPEATGTEITAKYYERIGLTGEHNIIVSNTKPVPSAGKTIWIKIID